MAQSFLVARFLGESSCPETSSSLYLFPKGGSWKSRVRSLPGVSTVH